MQKHTDHLQELSNTATCDVTNATGVEAHFPSISEHSRDNTGSSANASVPLRQPEGINQKPASEVHISNENTVLQNDIQHKLSEGDELPCVL